MKANERPRKGDMKQTSQLLDQPGPEGRVGEKIQKRGHHTHKQTDIATSRPTRPRGAELVKVADQNTHLNMYKFDCFNLDFK